jgi:hypothetical protein
MTRWTQRFRVVLGRLMHRIWMLQAHRALGKDRWGYYPHRCPICDQRLCPKCASTQLDVRIERDERPAKDAAWLAGKCRQCGADYDDIENSQGQQLLISIRP